MGKPAGQEQQTLSLRLPVIPLSASSVSHIYKRRKAPGRNVPGPFVCTLPTGWAGSWPEPASRNRCTAFCAAVFSPFSGFIALFTNVSHFYLSVVLQQHHLKPSQQCHSTISKAFQTVLLSLPYFPISLSFYAICRDYICDFWAFYPFFGIFSGAFPLVDRAPKV